MKRRIQRSMSLILCITLILSILSFSYVIYENNISIMKEEVKKEVLHISQGVNMGGIDYVNGILEYHTNSRITLIEEDGRVILDNEANPSGLENHKNRKEVVEAQRDGVGSATRFSASLGTQTFYYAMKLEDGGVIRVSRTTQSVLSTIFDLIPSFLLVGFLVFLVAMLMSYSETKKMIKPLNELDLEKPLENEIYDELSPLLRRIDISNKNKEETETMRREFSANVSHELKTPLTSISGYAELMKTGLVRAEDIQGFSEKIYDEASHMVVLIEDIIRISHLDEKGMEMEKREVDIYYIMREICSRLSFHTENKNVQLSISGGPVIIEAVPSVLDEMLYNIAENAVKYNKENGEVNIWVGSTLEGARVIVTDTGIGIPIEEQERIFERFYRVDKSHSKETGGTGLGLSIVKHAARLHNASITLESTPGNGTKIIIDFKH